MKLITTSIMTLSFAFSLSVSADSAQLERQANRLSRISNNLVNDVANLLTMPPGPQKRALKREMKDKLSRLQNVAQRMDANIRLPGQGGPGYPGPNPNPGPGYPGPNPGPGYPGPNPNPGPGYPGPYPGPNQANYQAECHIDDDTQFDYGQNIIGTLRGADVQEIMRECRAIARSTYGSLSSAGIKNIQFVGYIQPEMQTAECHVDDDTQHDFNQMVIGTVVGNSPAEIIRSCKEIARSMYGSLSSAGIIKLNVNGQVPWGKQSAQCHIDDDTQFDYNQLVVGTVYGNSYREMTDTCREIARLTYGSLSSGGIRGATPY